MVGVQVRFPAPDTCDLWQGCCQLIDSVYFKTARKLWADAGL